MKEISKQSICEAAILLLDDDDGVNEAGYDALCKLLEAVDASDILSVTDAADGRFFLKSTAAKVLRKKYGIKQ